MSMPTEAATWIYENVIAPIHALHPDRFPSGPPRCICTYNKPACHSCAAGKHEYCFEIEAPGWGHGSRRAGGDTCIVSRGMVLAPVWTPGSSHALHCHCHLRGHDGWTPPATQLDIFDALTDLENSTN